MYEINEIRWRAIILTITRQDAWTQDEDLFLAEVVLRHIREGGTQLSAFEEVGRALTRTAAACGFRWNSYVRKKYQSGIELAKKQRKELRKQIGVHVSNVSGIVKEVLPDSKQKLKQMSIQDVIQFLEQYKQTPSLSDYKNERENLIAQVNNLKKEIAELRLENETLKTKIELTEGDYKALIEIMDRARKMVVLKEDERSKKQTHSIT